MNGGMKVALIRHGKTVGNLYGAYIGRSDQPLCAEGTEELKKRCHHAMYPVVDAVFVSPLRRCVQTAEVIYPGQPCQKVPGLAERDFGRFDGLTHREIIALPGYGKWGSTADNMEFPGGERWEDFTQRTYEAFGQVLILAVEQSARRMAVVCHGGTIMALMEQLMGPPGSRFEWQCPPGCGIVLRMAEGLETVEIQRRISP